MTVELSEARLSLAVDFDDPLGQGVDQAVHDLVALKAAQAALREWEDVIVTYLHDSLGHNMTQVDGVGFVQVKRSASRKAWDHDAIARRVIAAGRDERTVDEETGEYEGEGEAVARALLDCAGIGYWRITRLADHGIDADEHCETTPGKLSVTIQ